MLSMLAFLLAVVGNVFLFFQWQNEKRRKALVHEMGSGTQRQSRRFQDSSLFDVMFGAGELYQPAETFQTFVDHFDSFADVTNAMKKAGLSLCDFVVAVDFTGSATFRCCCGALERAGPCVLTVGASRVINHASNEWQGRRTFNKNCLHAVIVKTMNPYQQVIVSLGATLEPFVGEHGAIHAFGFGDRDSRDTRVFSFGAPHGSTKGEDRPFASFAEVLARYTEIVKRIVPAGPTSFAPVIKKTVSMLRKSGGRFHVLIIITDGQMGDDQETVQAIVDASNYPLSIVLVGVGDGPWHRMEEYDDRLPKRRFDNFQFVDFHKSTTVGRRKNPQTAFALQALMEVPDQYKAIRDLGYL